LTYSTTRFDHGSNRYSKRPFQAGLKEIPIASAAMAVQATDSHPAKVRPSSPKELPR
jgi:hypothetical protein